MASGPNKPTPAGFARTCWRGISLHHPAEWEEAGLSGLNEPGNVVFADRRFQRLQVQWQVLKRPPDLERMYAQLKSRTEGDVEPLTGVPDWTGLVRRQKQGLLVHAGRFFEAGACLVQAVLVWPGARDRAVERAVLDSVAPQDRADRRTWQALGLSAAAPGDFELTKSTSLVGRVAWEFARSARPATGLLIERIALARYWLTGSLADWLAGQVPEGFRVLGKGTADMAGHAGARVASVGGNALSRLARRAVGRTDWAWACDRQERVYRVACWRSGAPAVHWPPGLEVDCCRPVAPPAEEP